MIHPLVRLIVNEPELLAEHFSAYAELIGSEAQHLKTRWTMRVLLFALSLCCIGVAAVLAGVALMLWAVTPQLTNTGLWALAAAPAIPAVVALVAVLVAMRAPQKDSLAAIQEQVAADIRMLKEVSTP